MNYDPMMGHRRITLSLPADVVRYVDAEAAARGETRSGIIREVLVRVMGARSDEEIRQRINEMYADPEVAAEQKEVARSLSRMRSVKETPECCAGRAPSRR